MQRSSAESLVRPAPVATLRRAWQRAAARFDEHAAVIDIVGGRLRERLDVLAESPTRILDLGCRTGYQLAALGEAFPAARVVGADPAPAPAPVLPRSFPRWLQRRPVAPARIACDPHALPFADESFDLVVSNLLLPFCRSPHRVFAEVARVLDTGGAFFFTSAGPDTLVEYRAAWAAVDAHAHHYGLIDMHDLGDAMLAAGFAAPVLDRDNVTVDYASLQALEDELRGVGAVNLASGRRSGLMSPAVRAQLHRAQGDRVRWPVTLELVQGHAWKGELRADGSDGGSGGGSTQTIALETVRRALRD